MDQVTHLLYKTNDSYLLLLAQVAKTEDLGTDNKEKLVDLQRKKKSIANFKLTPQK